MMPLNKRVELTQARTSKGLSRLELAQLAECGAEHIKSLEYGRVKPSTSLMFKICGILEASPSEVFKDIVNS